MIRWQYILTRLIVVAALLMLMRWSAGPVAQFVAVRSLQSATGAKVSIASTEVGLFPPRVHLRGVEIANPRKDMRNAFAADHIYLAIDGQALVRRRYEVAEGRISGIRIGGVRTESGALEVVPQEPAAEPTGPSQLQQWCRALAGDAQQQAEDFGDSLATVHEARRIRNHWETEYAALRSEAKQLEDDVRALKSTARSIDNPLRDLPALQDSLRRTEEIRQRLKYVTSRLDQLPSQFQSDLQAMDQARRADQQKVAAYFPKGLSGTPTDLGPELLGALVKDQLDQVRQYLESGRTIARATVASPQPQRARGETISLVRRPHPAWLMRQCSVDGFLSVDSEQYTMLGKLENITSDRASLDEPLRARLRLEGPRVVRIDYARHYDTPVPRDHLRIHWPKLDLPATRVGKKSLASKAAALIIDGGHLELWVDIEACGEEIQGRLVSKQTGTRVNLETGADLERTVVVQSLKSSLQSIDHVDVDARFAGNWRQIDLDINTNLTSCISDSLQLAIAAQVADTRERLTGEVDRAYERQSRELKEWVTTQQAGARDLVAQSNSAVETMSKKVVAELGAADAYLGKLRSKIGGLR